MGILDDPDKGVSGELVGAREDQMLLGEGNHVYLKIRHGVDVSVGKKLTVFGSSRPVGKVPGARQPKGEIVPVKGTVRIDQYNPRTHVARGEIIESAGDLVGKELTQADSFKSACSARFMARLSRTFSASLLPFSKS